MKKYITLVFIAIMPFCLWAQQMDRSSIIKLESGEYQLEPGKVLVAFSDTVSPEYAVDQLEKNGFEMLSSNFQNIVLSVENNPSPQQLREFEDNKWVSFVMSEAAENSDSEMETLSNSDSLSDDRLNEVLGELSYSSEYKYVMLSLTYKATDESVEEIKMAFPSLDFVVIEKSIREAVIKAEENKETEVMDALESLPFVKNTAMIGEVD